MELSAPNTALLIPVDVLKAAATAALAFGI